MPQGYQPTPPADKDTRSSLAPSQGQHEDERSGEPTLRGSRYQPVFPAALGAIWKRPLPAVVELCWRWFGSLPLLLFALHLWQRHGPELRLLAGSLTGLTFFQPVDSVRTLSVFVDGAASLLGPGLLPALPLCLAFWLVAAAVGRTAVLRMLARRIQPAAAAGKSAPALPLASRPTRIFLLMFVRSALLTLLYGLWAELALWFGRTTVMRQAEAGGEPHIVLFAALSVGSALLLFAFWCAVSWPLQLAGPLLLRPGSSLPGALRDARRISRRLRNELIEVNLVMGIVRLALLILLLVLSACPLPFQNVATAGFLVVWNVAAVILWLLGSDLFHTVRQAILLRLVRTWSTLLDS